MATRPLRHTPRAGPRAALLALALGAAGVAALAHAAALPARPAPARAAASAPAESPGPLPPQAPAPWATPARSTSVTLARPSPAAPDSAPPPSPAFTSSLPDPYDGDVPDAVVQRILDATSPADLPAPTTAAVVALARADLAADLGGGRAATGTAAGGAPHIQAAIARRHQGRTDVVDVTLIYQAADPSGAAQQYRVIFTYARCGAAWVPAVADQPGP